MEPKYSFESVDELIEIVSDGSQPITPRPKVTPILSEEEQAFADAVRRYQKEHRRAQLNWQDIFEIVHSLGYRKVDPPAAPPGANGDPQGDRSP
ncbi:MAG TPA: hypothetical protein VH682_19315 [Gemmataceae bacterium]|jgi:hypothetical protein